MKLWQARVDTERNELGVRYKALCEFIGKPAFTDLPLIEQNALSRQERAMAVYLGILTERIVRFDDG